jgi:hypothetical protein
MDIVPPVDIVWHIFPESAYFIRSFSGRPAIADLTIYCTSTLYEVVRACVLISRICKQSGGVLHDSCCILSTSVLFARVGMSVGCASMPPSRTVGSPRNTGPEMRWSAPGVRTQKGALAQPKIYYRSCASVTNIVGIAPNDLVIRARFQRSKQLHRKSVSQLVEKHQLETAFKPKSQQFQSHLSTSSSRSLCIHQQPDINKAQPVLRPPHLLHAYAPTLCDATSLHACHHPVRIPA